MTDLQKQIIRDEAYRCLQSSRIWPSPKLLARLLARQHPELVSEVIELSPEALDAICDAKTTAIPLCAATLWKH
jgi:hypothetical protein